MRLIRQLMSEWEAWLTFQQDPPVQPPKWEEADLFNNVLPWTKASTAQGITTEHLRFKLFCIQEELLRTEEELEYLPQDALNSLAYFQCQQDLLNVAQERCEVLLGAAARAQKYLEGRLHVLSSRQRHVGHLHHAAWVAFVKVDWIPPPE